MFEEELDLHSLTDGSIEEPGPVTVEREAQPLAGLADLLQPVQRETDPATLVVSVLYRHQLGHRQVRVVLPHLPLQLGQAEGPVVQVGEGPGVDPSQLGHSALLVDVDVGPVPQQDLRPSAPAVRHHADEVPHRPARHHQRSLLPGQLRHSLLW